MKPSHILCISLASALAVSGYGQVAPAPNPPESDFPSASSAEQKVLLPAYQVESTVANQYSAEDAASISRISSNIIDSPMSVSVISPALLQDLGPTALLSDVTYFAGMSAGRGAGPGGIADRMDFRGFESLGGKLVDDFSQYLQPTGAGPHINLDPVLVDHAEMVMGPDTILSPTGSPAAR